MERPLNRVEPALPAGAMQTHQVAMPRSTHWRSATCEEVGCQDFEKGWLLPLSGLDEGDIWQARNSGRRYRELDTDAGVVLVFEAGQPCFRAFGHYAPRDREPLFIARDGDWRGNPRGTEPLVFSGEDAFSDHLHTHLGKFNR